jgi:ABC-type antimicrobial peptide transport system permease subunit
VYELDYYDHKHETQYPEEQQWLLLNNEIYLHLDGKADAQAFEKKRAAYMIDRGVNESVRLSLVPLRDIRHTFGSELSFNITYIRTFVITVLLLLFCVFFNFINILLNRIHQRIREMRLRSALGARKQTLLAQLLCEITVQAVLAILLAFCLFELSGDTFMRLFETKIVKGDFLRHLFLISCLSWVVIVAVSLPLLLRFIRSTNLPVSGGTPAHRRGDFRRTGLIVQTGICVFFLLCALIIGRQIAFMQQKDLGFKREGLIYMQMEARDREGISREIASLSLVKSFSSGGNFRLTHEPNTQNEVKWEGQAPGFAPNFQVLNVGEDFFATFGITLLEGRFVDDGDILPDKWRMSSNAAVVNETAVRIMEMSEPTGKTVSVWDYTTHQDGTHGSSEMKIVGVVKDFQAASLRKPVLPVIMLCDGSKWGGYTNYVRVAPEDEQTAMAAIRKVFKKHYQEGDKESPVQTMEEIFRQLSTSERASLRLFALLAAICILISAFGIYAISYSNIEQRRKEIAVRKVTGASTGSIIRMFLLEYVAIAVMANLVFLPLAWLFIRTWLEQYPWRATLPVWLYALVFLLTTLLTAITILYQTVRAAKTNPADVIKTE